MYTGGMEFLLGDCVEVLLRLPASSVDVVICDPPYALSRGRTWDKTDACLLDPFAGTGTVAVAASGVTSNVISIEIDETYLRIAEARTVAAGAGEDVTSLVGQLFEQGG